MNQTDVRTFKAASMQEALDIVRREMGPDAVILNTREIAPPRFLKWRKTSDRVEVTAGTGVNVRMPRGTMRPSSPPRSSGIATSPAGTPGQPMRPADGLLAPAPSLPGRVSSTPRSTYGGLAAASLSQVPAAGLSDAAPAPQIFPSREITEQQTAITRQLNSIQQMMAQLTKGSLQKTNDIPGELFQLYTELIDVEVEEELARGLIDQLKQNISPEMLADAAASKGRLRAMVEAEVRTTAPIIAAPGRRRVVALVGPTGVGKTTTIAKLAANFRLRDGIRMGLVTVDTYRIAAVEQLRTYAEIIDLPMKVVTSPREMRRALDELSGLDLVLIDTAGRSPRDELKIQELKSLLAEAHVDEVHLVLSMVASPKSLQATAEKFAPAGTTAMILTKLDEAVGMGSLLSVARRVPLPVSYLTTGQDVPDDIEHASARRVARLILGEESLFARRKAV
jgi:flagellar biosynthesis protein FlhF